MKKISNQIIKSTITIISLLGLITNASPLLAWTVDIEVMGGGYKIDTAPIINLPEINTSTSEVTSQINFSDIAEKNYISIVDQNGNTPFDVSITASQLVKEETWQGTVIAGSTLNTVKVNSITGINIGDTITISSFPNSIFTITAIPDTNYLSVTPDMSNIPATDSIVSSVVNCNISPQKCISLNNYKISSSTAEIINGSTDGILTAPFEQFQAFGAETLTTADSTGNTLNVENSSSFLPNESIDLIDSSGAITTYTIYSVNQNSLSLDAALPANLPADLKVKSSVSRTLTLAKGTGSEAGEYRIHPTLKATISPGQKPGKYISTIFVSIF